MEDLWRIYEGFMEGLWRIYDGFMEDLLMRLAADSLLSRWQLYFAFCMNLYELDFLRVFRCSAFFKFPPSQVTAEPGPQTCHSCPSRLFFVLEIYGGFMKDLWRIYDGFMEGLWRIYEGFMDKFSEF